jgi:hypothetical protein
LRLGEATFRDGVQHGGAQAVNGATWRWSVWNFLEASQLDAVGEIVALVLMAAASSANARSNDCRSRLGDLALALPGGGQHLE